jgi:hypothetical protein
VRAAPRRRRPRPARACRRHLGLDAPVFVAGDNLQRAALVADRLTDGGYLQVFLVTR